MKYRKIVFLLFFVVGLTSLFNACGRRVEKDDKTSAVATTDDQQITKMIQDAMYRLRQGDKSALYELEFAYERYQTNFDRYLGIQRVQWATADSLESVHIDTINYFLPESAHVFCRVHFKGPTGSESFFDEKLVVYKDEGRWIKPTVSTWAKNQEYLDIYRQADSTAKAEAAGS